MAKAVFEYHDKDGLMFRIGDEVIVDFTKTGREHPGRIVSFIAGMGSATVEIKMTRILSAK